MIRTHESQGLHHVPLSWDNAVRRPSAFVPALHRLGAAGDHLEWRWRGHDDGG